MHKPESDLENETHKILRNFEIQIDHLIPAIRADIVIINKKKRTEYIVNVDVTADHRVKNQKRNER